MLAIIVTDLRSCEVDNVIIVLAEEDAVRIVKEIYGVEFENTVNGGIIEEVDEGIYQIVPNDKLLGEYNRNSLCFDLYKAEDYLTK